MSQARRLVRIAQTDFSYFFRTKWLMAVLISLNLSDMLVTAVVYKQFVKGLDYFRFLVPGIVVMGLFTAATDTGRRIWLALREGVMQYYLTLPIPTSGLALAYIISGGLTGLVYSSSLLLIASILIGPQGILNVLALLPFLFVLSVGIAGLAAFFASISRQGEIFWVYIQSLQIVLVTISTIFYPISLINQFLPAPIGMLAQANPLSLAAQALRDSVFGSNGLDPSLLASLSYTSIPLAIIGGAAYVTILRTIRVRGKA